MTPIGTLSEVGSNFVGQSKCANRPTPIEPR
jgi:hypothetical protein